LLRIAICDDDSITRDEIAKKLDEYSRIRNLDIICDQYATGASFLSSKHTYQLVILDYMLDKDKKYNGLSVAQELRQLKKEISIIFLTNYPKVVFASFEVAAFRFLVKPLDTAKLFNALDAFLKTLDTDSTLMIRKEGAVNVLNTKEILFLEGDGKYCIIHMTHRPKLIMCHETLAQVEHRLPPQFFCRCHRSYIVNLKYVSSYDHQEITLQNGARIFISRSKHNFFEDNFMDFSKRYGY
jgi:DNA-binding LytR/AlgR family response regulator